MMKIWKVDIRPLDYNIVYYTIVYYNSVLNMDIQNICGNRLRQMLYNINTNRYTPQSPYVQNAQGQLVYTQDQLDMRRKAEILLYPHSNQNSKKNGITKKQRWSQVVRSVFPTEMSCPNLDLVPTPTSSSGIPGPVRYLIRDTTVPLYNFNNNNEPYATTTIDDPATWKSFSANNVLCQNITLTKLFTLFITNKNDVNQRSFTFSSPYAVYIQGTDITTSTTTSKRIPDMSLNINSVEATVLYNDIAVDTSVTVSKTNASVVYDVSMNTVQNKSYAFYCYMGIMTVDIPVLYTAPGYVYDVKVSFNMTLTPPTPTPLIPTPPINTPIIPNYNATFNTSVAILCNLDKENVLNSQGGVLKPSSIIVQVPPFQPYKIVEN